MQQRIYTLFLGLLLALFIGIGIDTFAPAPTYPDHPDELMGGTEVENIVVAPVGESATITPPHGESAQAAYDEAVKQYDEEVKGHALTTAISSFVAGILLLVVALLWLRRSPVLSDGFLLGGMLALLYSVGWSLATAQSVVSFGIVTLGLIVTLVLGARTFAARA